MPIRAAAVSFLAALSANAALAAAPNTPDVTTTESEDTRTLAAIAYIAPPTFAEPDLAAGFARGTTIGALEICGAVAARTSGAQFPPLAIAAQAALESVVEADAPGHRQTAILAAAEIGVAFARETGGVVLGDPEDGRIALLDEGLCGVLGKAVLDSLLARAARE